MSHSAAVLKNKSVQFLPNQRMAGISPSLPLPGRGDKTCQDEKNDLTHSRNIPASVGRVRKYGASISEKFNFTCISVKFN